MHGIRGVDAYRTIWISDTHLGTRGCKAEFLLDFLKYTQSERLYLALRFSWRRSAEQFLGNLVPAHRGSAATAADPALQQRFPAAPGSR